MKRLVSFLLVMILLVSAAPVVHAYSGPIISSNINDHFYVNANRWTDPIKSTLYAENGGYVRVEYVEQNYYTGDPASMIVEYYDANLKFTSGMELAEELPIYGGVYIAKDYNFLVTGQNNTEENDSKEVFRITRYTKNWKRIDSASLYGANTTYPFDAGCVRFDRSGNMLYIRTSHEMYTTSDGLNHQANVMIALRISDMTITDSYTGILNRNYGYISHSFNQFVRVDGTTLLAVDHGDALPRSIVLIKYNKPAGQDTFFGKVTYVNALNIVDSTYHYNDTGVSVGGFEYSSSNYLIAGCSYDQLEEANLINVHRNIFVTATPKNNFTDAATTIHWLTDYTAADNVRVSPPHMVKVNSDRFFLTWTENGVLKYCFVNGSGQLEGKIYTGEGDLSDCVPILDGNRILWYVTDSSEPVFYQVNLNGTQDVPHTHSYSAEVTAPSCTKAGFTTYTCACGHSYIADEVKAPGHNWKDATCTTAKTCETCGATEGKALGHSYSNGACDTCGEKDPDYVDPKPQGNVIRLAGAHRYETALKVADQLKKVLNVQKFDAVIIASGGNFADALAGSYLSTVKNAPILLSFGGGGKYAYLDTDNIDYINANLKPGGTVYLLGGENAVPKLYDDELSNFNVKRLGGTDRFETNLMILREAGVKPGQEILVCTATEFADSLSASATGQPILLVFNQKGALYGGQPDYLQSLCGQNSFCIIGGTSAVGAKLEKALGQYGKVTRLAGSDRLNTSVMVAEKYFPNATSAVVAYGWDYPDGLCGGALAYAMKAPLLLTYSAPKYYAIAADYTARQGINSGVVLGGEKLISQAAVDAIF